MQRQGDRLRFTAGDLTTFAASEFASWMDRWWSERERGRVTSLPVSRPVDAHAAHGLPLFATLPERQALDCAPEAPGADTQVLLERGRAHERAVLAQFRAAGRDVHEIASGPRAAEATRAALTAGAEIVYQAHLSDAVFDGRADFLLRTAAAGAGAPAYEPADAKLAHAVKPEHVVQLCLYARLLAGMQSERPLAAHVFLGDGRVERIELDRYRHYVDRLIAEFLDTQRRFDAMAMPHPGRDTQHGRWSACAEAIVASTDHLRGVAEIRPDQIRKLERAGIATMTELASWSATPGEIAAWHGLDLARGPRKGPRASAGKRTPSRAPVATALPAAPVRVAPGIRAETLARLSTQARLQIESRGAAVPLWEARPVEDASVRRGFALLPPSAPLDVFFDMESHPLAEGKLEYLFGAAHADTGIVQFSDWWALSRDQERAAFEGFVDWAWQRWQRDPGMHIYHYANYEVAALRRLMGEYASRENIVDELLRNEVFVDLYQVVHQGLVIGTRGYSLKDIEPLYRPPRAGTVRNADGCMAAFERWLEHPDGDAWQRSPILAAIRDYNRDDCESTHDLAAWLRGVQRELGIAWVPSVREAARLQLAAGGVATVFGAPSAASSADSDSDDDEPDTTPASQRAIEVLLAMATASTDPEQARVAALLAQLVGFHRREMKPTWWRLFDRVGKRSDELEHDFECLAGLERVAALTNTASDWEYRWDPDQDTKLEPGDICCLAADIDAEVRIESLDVDSGRVRLHPLRNLFAAPERLDLVLKDIVGPWPLANAVLRYALAWAEGRPAAPAVDDLLHRRPPRIAGHTGGAIAPPGPGFAAALAHAVSALQSSTLCIQGPPGTGKTYTASNLVLELLRAGRIVGVLANSHKAVDNLMHAVLQRAAEAGFAVGRDAAVRVVKFGGEVATDAPDVVSGRLEWIKENRRVREVVRARESGTGLLIGGSAWCFAQVPEQAVDTLFVDEAGQVSLANLVAAGLAARNLVLVGDQMQLAQPIQGAHPGDSGQSALEYLLQGRATIADEFGVLLGTTHRMHPDVCTFVSDAVYEGRVHAHPKTAERRILFGPHVGERLLRRASGIVWVPIPHEGNSQASDEEVDAVDRIVHELLAARWRDGARPERPMRLTDVLVVAPYNMQVRQIQRRLRTTWQAEPRVGSVDRFQGQEAPAVVVSMCASTIEDVPRGLEFLLSPNRLNVAVSRAQCLAVVVGSPALLAARCKTLEQMRLLDLYCRLVEYAQQQAGAPMPMDRT